MANVHSPIALPAELFLPVMEALKAARSEATLARLTAASRGMRALGDPVLMGGLEMDMRRTPGKWKEVVGRAGRHVRRAHVIAGKGTGWGALVAALLEKCPRLQTLVVQVDEADEVGSVTEAIAAELGTELAKAGSPSLSALESFLLSYAGDSPALPDALLPLLARAPQLRSWTLRGPAVALADLPPRLAAVPCSLSLRLRRDQPAAIPPSTACLHLRAADPATLHATLLAAPATASLSLSCPFVPSLPPHTGPLRRLSLATFHGDPSALPAALALAAHPSYAPEAVSLHSASFTDPLLDPDWHRALAALLSPPTLRTLTVSPCRPQSLAGILAGPLPPRLSSLVLAGVPAADAAGMLRRAAMLLFALREAGRMPFDEAGCEIEVRGEEGGRWRWNAGRYCFEAVEGAK